MATIQKQRQCEGVIGAGSWYRTPGRCKNVLPPQEGPGRAKRFCSDTCRSSARRDREQKALAHLPKCFECHSNAQHFVLLSTMRRIEVCARDLAKVEQLAKTFGVKVLEANDYDLAGLKRAELLREEKARMGIELRGQVTLDELVEELDEEEATELVEATEEAERHRLRQELYGDTGNIGRANKSSRCRNRHHEECDGAMRVNGIQQALCLCQCH